MMSVHKKPDGRWYVSFRDSTGQQRTKTFGRGKLAEKEAEAVDRELEAGRKRGIRPEPTSEVYIHHLAQSYIDDKRVRDASSTYINDVKNLINNHISKVLPSNKTVDRLTYSDMQGVLEYYKDRSIATKNRYMQYLNAIFSYGIEHGLTKNNPLARWKKTKEPRRRVCLKVEDLQRLMQHAEPHLKWAIEVSWNLGTRPGPSELLSLRWEHVDFPGSSVRIFAGKTKELRTVGISDAFRIRLLAQKELALSDHVIEYQGRPINKLRRSFKTAYKRAGISYPVRMYDIRHLFASVMLAGGADLAAVSKLMGHSTTQMTANVYYELLEGEKRRAVSLLPSLHEDEKKPE
jgi:integrase